MVLRHVSILRDHPQGVCLYLAKDTELFKRLEEFLNNPVTLARYRPTPWRWSLKIETCRSTFKYFYVF